MLPEISLNVLDIAQNSIRAQAKLIEISIHIDLNSNVLNLIMSDDGYGMTDEEVSKVVDPFYTSRSTRGVGFGVPFVKQEVEATGGTFQMSSKINVGTTLRATFNKDSIDCMPLGDICSTIHLLIISNETLEFVFQYKVNNQGFILDTREIRKICGDIPLSNLEISKFIKDFLEENISEVNQGQVF